VKIDIQGLTKTYRKPDGTEHKVLSDITFSIDRGDFVIVLGESGCGKTTLLNLIAGFEKPSSGAVYADGEIVDRVHPSRLMLFQRPALIPWLNVRRNVAYGCRLRGDVEDLEYRVNQFLEIMGLLRFAESKPEELSMGMAHRACLAMALVGHPRALLLDEPFAALDTFTQAHIQEELVNLWQSEQFSAVFVTHDIDEAISLGNRIVLLGGDPTGVKEILDIDDEYPRKKDSARFKELRTDILERFKKSYLAKRGIV
jgi:ABC-type nitrate/sulfonate/bicarbonate transport system ATPase subunit